ncbi:MAG TPA: amidohydrolase family protein [Mycobacteriales bacterium]|nr:amidohydrolase family protein [Mycobacteriales bacterium]
MTMTLLRGGRIHTPAGPPATALLVDGDTVAWVGTDDAAAAASPGRVVELAGALVTPAFVDAHVHATQNGLALTGLDLGGARSVAQALAAVEAHARGLRGRVVLGTGWDETRWPERRPPSPAELDRASYGGVVYLARVDHHSAVVSSALLAACPEARGLAGYDDSGQLTLVAHHAVRRTAYESITPAQRTAAQRACRKRAAALGVGCLQEMAGPQISGGLADLEALLRLAEAEPGPEVLAYWGELASRDEPAGLDTVALLGLAGAGGDLFCDGSIGSHTAALGAPYADAPGTTGHLWHDVDAIAEHVAACTRAGVQAGFHAIGDRALRTVLDGVAQAAEVVGLGAVVAQRHRVEHAEMPPSVADFARFGLVASVQPAFDATWGGRDGMYAGRLGADRAAGLNPFASFASAGVPLALGSDAPVTPIDPWGGVRAAVHHRTPGAGISPAVAFAAATRGGWLAARRGAGGAGLLRPGSPATYAIWDVAGLPPAGPDGLPGLDPGAALPACLRTVVRGVTIYERG